MLCYASPNAFSVLLCLKLSFKYLLVVWVCICVFPLRPGHCQDFSDQSLMILQMTWLFTGHLDSFQTSVTYVFSSEWAELSRQWRGHASSVTLTTESIFCCHFVASHYPNENMTGRNVTQNGHGWAACQNSFTFLFFCECRQRDYGERVEDGVIMPQAHGQHLNPPVRTDVWFLLRIHLRENSKNRQMASRLIQLKASCTITILSYTISLNLGQNVWWVRIAIWHH